MHHPHLAHHIRHQKSDLNCRTRQCQLVEVHAHFVKCLPEVIVAFDRPAHLQQTVFGIELDSWLVLIETASTCR